MGPLPEFWVQIFVEVNLYWTFPELNPCVMHFGHNLHAVQNFYSFWSYSTGCPKLTFILVTFYRLSKTFIYFDHILQASPKLSFILITFYRRSKTFSNFCNILQAPQNFHSCWSHSTGCSKLSIILVTFYSLSKTFIHFDHILQAVQNFQYFRSHLQAVQNFQ